MMIVVAMVIGYFLGAIPFAWLVAKSAGVNIFNVGSGNAGMTNVLRTLGIGPALIVLIGDMSKGVLAAFIGQHIAGDTGMILAGATAIIGHTLSCFLNFRGGKGVATAAGVFLYISPLAFLLCFLTLGIGAVTTRYMSVGSILAAIGAPFYLWLAGAPPLFIVIVIFLSLYVIWLHRSNIKRLQQGTENKISFKKKKVKE